VAAAHRVGLVYPHGEANQRYTNKIVQGKR